jgi:hypothetical protein
VRDYLLADKEHVDGAQVEVIKERKRGKTIIGWMLARIELQRQR